MHILIQSLTFLVVLLVIADFLLQANLTGPYADPSEGPWKNP